MPAFARSKCRDCDAEIIWTRTAATGKRMPVDADPVKDGNVVLTAQGDETVSNVLTVKDGPIDERAARYRSHFVSCPNAAGRRKR